VGINVKLIGPETSFFNTKRLPASWRLTISSPNLSIHITPLYPYKHITMPLFDLKKNLVFVNTLT
jgi:hypothetical protein